MNNYKTLCEVEISTKNPECHHLGAGLYDFAIGPYLDFDDEKPIFIGAKNVRWHIKKLDVDFEMALMKRSSDFEKKQLSRVRFSFNSLDELAALLEHFANATLKENPTTCLNMTKPGENHICIDSTILPYTMSLKYKHRRFFMRLHHDLMIVMSTKVADFLRMSSSGQIKGDYVVFTQNCAISEDYVKLYSSIQKSFCLVVYDLIKEVRVSKNGTRYEVLFDYKMEDKYKCQELLCARELVSKDSIRQFRFELFTDQMQKWDGEDVIFDNLSFTIVFFRL